MNKSLVIVSALKLGDKELQGLVLFNCLCCQLSCVMPCPVLLPPIAIRVRSLLKKRGDWGWGGRVG